MPFSICRDPQLGLNISENLKVQGRYPIPRRELSAARSGVCVMNAHFRGNDETTQIETELMEGRYGSFGR